MPAGDCVEGHRRGRNEVFQSHVRGFAPNGVRHRIERQLHRHADARLRHAAIRNNGRLVGRDGKGPTAISLNVVAAGQIALRVQGLKRDRHRPRRIGAGVHRDLRIQREDASAPVGVGGHQVMVLPRIRRRDQVLAPIFGPSHRLFPGQREPRDEQLLGCRTDLPPNPPPTSGAMTRITPSSMPRYSASAVRMMWGACVEV